MNLYKTVPQRINSRMPKLAEAKKGAKMIDAFWTRR
jgi:hypothetical protein